MEELIPKNKRGGKRIGGGTPGDDEFDEFSLLKNRVDFGQTCQILDSEQVNCFILDSLCNDIFLNRMIEQKRKYDITTNFEIY